MEDNRVMVSICSYQHLIGLLVSASLFFFFFYMLRFTSTLLARADENQSIKVE